MYSNSKKHLAKYDKEELVEILYNVRVKMRSVNAENTMLKKQVKELEKKSKGSLKC